MLSHPVFLAGFRPFFLLAIVAGIAYPLLWAAAFAGGLRLPAGGLEPTVWHAHEMLYGFGWAVLGGFLLTSSKNWVRIRGLHGGPLALAAALWCVERVAVFAWGRSAREPVVFVLVNAFALYVIGYLVWTLVKFRKQDFYKDNWIFVVALPVFLVARNLMLDPATYAVGVAMSIGLFRVAFAVMFERTITQFMKNAAGIDLLQNPVLDYGIKLLVLACVFEAWLPARVAAVLLSLAAALLFVRLVLWKPFEAMKRFGIGIMYVGYLGLVAHLTLSAMRLTGMWTGIGTLPVHVFTFLCMGLIIPSMFVRIAQGHTGRKPQFMTSDKVALGLMGLGAFFRLVATQLWPAQYPLWITLSAVGWSACFLVIGLRVGPFMLKPRIDGKEH